MRHGKNGMARTARLRCVSQLEPTQIGVVGIILWHSIVILAVEQCHLKPLCRQRHGHEAYHAERSKEQSTKNPAPSIRCAHASLLRTGSRSKSFWRKDAMGGRNAWSTAAVDIHRLDEGDIDQTPF
jgi:hypothetical protein